LILRDRDTADDGTPEQRHYALQDANYSVTCIVDTNGDAAERYLYTPYGVRAIFDGTFNSIGSSAYGWDVGHQGLMHDTNTSLVYNRARMLHPGLGRFMQRDPLGYVDGMSLYEYVRSAPEQSRDPLGAALSQQEIDRLLRMSENELLQWIKEHPDEQRDAYKKLRRLNPQQAQRFYKMQKFAGLRNIRKRKGVADGKVLGALALAACEAYCLEEYEDCIAESEDKMNEYVAGIGSLLPKEDVDKTIKAAKDAQMYEALGCATKYAACGLGCLCPFSIFD
jgi:RHS repeat-associated protein